MTYCFDEFKLDAEQRQLIRRGERVEVQPQVAELLLYLVENRERTVSKSELLDKLWGGVIVGDHVLTSAIQKVRAALGDSSARQWAIKTESRRGYRFVARLEAEVAPAPAQAGPAGERFVGRRDALEHLEATFESVLSGRGHCVLLVGAPGIGKTRTAEEFTQRARAKGALVLAGWCEASEGAPPYWPWVQVLRAAARGRDPEELRECAGAGAADIAGLLPELHDVLPGLPAAPELEPEEARFRLFDSIATFLQKVSQRAPIVLWFDDLHAADPSSLRLLKLFAKELKRSRILLLGTLRAEDGEPDGALARALSELTRSASAERVTLQGLDGDEISELIQTMVGAEPSGELVQSLATKTEGNPLFLKEIISNALAQHPSGGLAGLAPESLSIPPGVRDAIRERMGPLSEACRGVLIVASIFGREFEIGIVSRVSDLGEERVEELMEEASELGIVSELDASGSLRFSHGLIQEVLYAEQSSLRRARLHARAGEELEKQCDGKPGPYVPELAYHFSAAAGRGRVDKAISYSVLAAERATASHAYEEASAYYQRALVALELRDADDESERYELLLALGTAQCAAGEYEARGRETLLRAADLGRKLAVPEKFSRAVLGLGVAAGSEVVDDEVLIALHEEALDALGEEPLASRAKLLGRLAAQLYGSSFDRGERLSAEAVQIARRANEPDALGETLNFRLLYLSHPLHLDERMTTASELLRLGAVAKNKTFSAYAHRWRLISLLELGDLPLFDAELEAYRAVDDRSLFSEWHFITLAAMRAFLVGRFADAERLVLEASAILQRRPHSLAMVVFALQLSMVRREQARLPELAPFLSATMDLGSQHPAYRSYRSAIAYIHAELGELDEARAEFERLAARGFEDLPEDVTQLFSLAVLSEACVLLRDTKRAEPLYERMLPCAHLNVVAGNSSICLGSTSRFLGILASLLGRWEAAESHFEEALQMHERMGAHPWLAYTRLNLAEMLLSKGGRDPRIAGLLEQSRATATELGMTALVGKLDALEAAAR